jgi:HAMP domain-containing protein
MFDIEGARKAGYSEGEIADYLAKERNFDLEGARKAGYGDADIIGHLTKKTTGESFTRGLGLGVRDAIQGFGQLPGMVVDAVNAPVNLGIRGVNAVAGTNIPQIPPVATTLSGASDAMGLPAPVTSGEKVRSAIGQNVAGLIPSMGAGMALQGVKGGQFVGNALTAAPVSQLAGAAGAGAAGEMANQAEWGPAQQFGAALAGGVAGASLPMLAGGAMRGIAAASQPFTEGGRRKIIGEALLRNSSDPPTLPTRLVDGADDAARRLPDSPVTSGVAARDPQMMILEAGLRSDVQAPPGGMSPAAAIRDVEAVRNANRLKTAEALQRGPLPDATARGDQVGRTLGQGKGAMDARTSQLFDIARDRNPNRYSVKPVLDRAKDATRMFDPKQGGEGVPAALQGVIDDLAKLERVDINQAQNIRSRLGAIAGEASRAGNNRLASAAGAISDSLEQQIDDPRWMAAVAQRRAVGEALGRDASGAAATGAILRTDRFGAPMMTSDAAIKKALETPQAARQVLDAGYKALDDARAARLPQAEVQMLADNVRLMRQSLRDQFAENLTRASSTTGDIVDASGKASRLLSPAQFTRWWEQNKKVADVLFDAAERKTLDRLAADFAETSITGTARARGSDTAQNLSVGNFIARLTNGVIDPQNPLAQSVGRLGPIADWIVRSPEQAMREMLTHAIRDPKFAAELVKGAGPDSLERAVLYWQQTMPQRVRDAALGAGVRATPRIGLEPPTPSQTPAPRLTGR